MINRLCLAILLSLTPACVIVPAAVENQIKSKVSTTQKDLQDWATMTPAEQHEALWAEGRVIADLNLSINDVPLPPEFAGTYADYIAAIGSTR